MTRALLIVCGLLGLGVGVAVGLVFAGAAVMAAAEDTHHVDLGSVEVTSGPGRNPGRRDTTP